MILIAYDFTSPISCSARFCQGECGSVDVVGNPIFLVNLLKAPFVKLGWLSVCNEKGSPTSSMKDLMECLVSSPVSDSDGENF